MFNVQQTSVIVRNRNAGQTTLLGGTLPSKNRQENRQLKVHDFSFEKPQSMCLSVQRSIYWGERGEASPPKKVLLKKNSAISNKDFF